MQKRYSDYDPNYVAIVPTATLTATHGVASVVTKLYGEVSPERREAEQRMTNYRAEQLDPPKKRVVVERPMREPADDLVDTYEKF